MRQIISNDLAPIGTIHVGHLDPIGLCVAPVDLLTLQIQGDAVRPNDVFGDQQHALATVEITALDFRPLLIPIGPKHPAERRCDCDRSWLEQIFVH